MSTETPGAGTLTLKLDEPETSEMRRLLDVALRKTSCRGPSHPHARLSRSPAEGAEFALAEIDEEASSRQLVTSRWAR